MLLASTSSSHTPAYPCPSYRYRLHSSRIQVVVEPLRSVVEYLRSDVQLDSIGSLLIRNTTWIWCGSEEGPVTRGGGCVTLPKRD